jgi:hypothetical protein
MAKYLYVLLLLTFSIKGYSQKKVKQDSFFIINWHDKVNLQWSDFMGEPDSTIKTSFGNATAVSAIHITVEPTFDFHEMPNYKVYNSFIKTKSFVVDSTKVRRGLLEHEKLHFDLYEVYTRRIRKGICQLRKQENYNVHDYEDLIDNLLYEVKKANKLFDKETAHSNLKIMQDKWKVKIMKELELLKDFK